MDYESMKDVSKNMRRTGMLLFRSALYESLYEDIPMCIVHVAHAAEILLKARIAQEHPLLIFSKLPKTDHNLDKLSLMNLLKKGRTFSYDELPDQLWATTGIKISPEQLKEYREFGQLRNQIIHFGISNQQKLERIAVEYCLNFLDPLVESFWGHSVIEFIRKNPDNWNPHNSKSDPYDGFLEESISNFVTIDKRLRRLLGEESLKSIQLRTQYFLDQDKFHQSLTEEDFYRQYEDYIGSTDPAIIEMQEEQEQIYQKAINNWNLFLESF